jgi:hypothetical protein
MCLFHFLEVGNTCDGVDALVDSSRALQGGGDSGSGLPTGGAPDRIWLGCLSALLPGVEGGQVGQVGAGGRTGRFTAVERAAGDGEEAFFRHDDCHQAILGE